MEISLLACSAPACFNLSRLHFQLPTPLHFASGCKVSVSVTNRDFGLDLDLDLDLDLERVVAINALAACQRRQPAILVTQPWHYSKTPTCGCSTACISFLPLHETFKLAQAQSLQSTVWYNMAPDIAIDTSEDSSQRQVDSMLPHVLSCPSAAPVDARPICPSPTSHLPILHPWGHTLLHHIWPCPLPL